MGIFSSAGGFISPGLLIGFNDFDTDMAKLAQEPRNMEWLKVCDTTQIPLPGANGWTVMERVYFNQ